MLEYGVQVSSSVGFETDEIGIETQTKGISHTYPEDVSESSWNWT